jgi:hypothetical protein
MPSMLYAYRLIRASHPVSSVTNIQSLLDEIELSFQNARCRIPMHRKLYLFLTSYNYRALCEDAKRELGQVVTRVVETQVSV